MAWTRQTQKSRGLFPDTKSFGLQWHHLWDPCSSVGKESACNAGDPGLIPGSGRSPGEGHGNPLQYSCLENPMNGGAWQATVRGVTRVRHDLVTKPPWDPKSLTWVVLYWTHSVSCHNLLAWWWTGNWVILIICNLLWEMFRLDHRHISQEGKKQSDFFRQVSV